MSIARSYRNYVRTRGIAGEMQRPSRFHITLMYLASASEEQLALLFGDVGFPMRFRTEFVRPAMLGDSLVLLVNPEPGLVGLQRTLWQKALELGCQPDDKGFSNPENYKPHLTILNHVRQFDISLLPVHPALPFHLSASHIVIGREEYDRVHSMRLPASAGDRVLVEQGGPWVWPTEPRKVVTKDQTFALLRGDSVLVGRRIVTLGTPLAVRGGPGSGNIGHAGRPGQVGGSAPGGGGAAYDEKDELARVNYEGPHGTETIGGWLDRHEVQRTSGGLYVFYHATPKRGGVRGELRAGSLLEQDPKAAAFFASRDRDLDPERDVTVIRLELRPSQIDGGQWASLREDITFGEDVVERGGPGSGNIGHAGRPGQVGGSAPGADRDETKEPPRRFSLPRLMADPRTQVWGIKQRGKVYVAATQAGANHNDLATEAGLSASDQFWSRGLYGVRDGIPFLVMYEDIYHYGAGANLTHAIEHVDKILDAVGHSGPTPPLYVSGDTLSAKRLTPEDLADLTQRGGPGSGNIGHAGRPGQVGGSAPGGGGGPQPERFDNGRAFPPAYLAGLRDAIKHATDGDGRHLADVVPVDDVEGGFMHSYFLTPDGTLVRSHQEHSDAAWAASMSVRESGVMTPEEVNEFKRVGALDAVLASGSFRMTVFKEGATYQASTKATQAQRDTAAQIAELIGLPVSQWTADSYGWRGEPLTDAAVARLIGLTERGGPGSGNMGHAGRPGQVGGSAPGDAAGEGLASAVKTWKESGAWNASKRDIQRGFQAGIRYDPKMSAGLVAHQYVPGVITVGDAFFEQDYVGRVATLFHEVGHQVASRILSAPGANPLEDFRTGPDAFENFAGASTKPEEMVADIYASLVMDGAKNWEADRYQGVYQAVARGAAEENLPATPLFQWFHGTLTERGGPGSGNIGHAGRPGQVGGSAPGEGGDVAPTEARQRGGQFGAKSNINRGGEPRDFVAERMAHHLGRSVTFGYGTVDEFYDRVRQQAPEGLWVRDEEGHTLYIVAADGGTHGWEPRTVAVGGLFAAETGKRVNEAPMDAPHGRFGGMGTAFMNALKDYADASDKKLIVHQVANPDFFNRFQWLKRDDTETYRYQSLGYTMGTGKE
jgi:2'-5' RNA ligase